MNKQIDKSIDEVCDKYLSKNISKAIEDGNFGLSERPGITIEKLKLPFGILIKKLFIAKSTVAIALAISACTAVVLLFLYL